MLKKYVSIAMRSFRKNKDLSFIKVTRLALRLALIAGGHYVSLPVHAQDGLSPEISRKIAAVESHLGGWVQEENVPTWTLQERMRHYGLQGLSIAVVNNYKIEWAKGYGLADSAERRIVSTATLFQAASLSKSVNAVGVMKLVQDGRIDLDADINTYLKKWKFPYDSLARGKTISIGNLLSHTAGLTVHGFGGYQPGDSIPSIYEVLDGKPPANSPKVRSMFEPGLRSEYSGGGITISQLIVQDITGEPYDVFMWKNVLLPMGMTGSTYTQPPGQDKSLLATGYQYNGEEVKGKYHIYPEQAAAGLWTSPSDYARYIIETQLSYEGRSAKVLNQSTTKRRLKGYIDSIAALGVFINTKGEEKYFAHSGANEGFRCLYYGSLQGGKGVVIMVNSDNGDILNELLNSVATVYQWKDFYHPEVRKRYLLPDSVRDSYTGRYATPGDTARVLAKDGQLFVVSRQGTLQLHFTSDREFWLYERPGASLEFTVTGGKVEGILINHKQTVRRID